MKWGWRSRRSDSLPPPVLRDLMYELEATDSRQIPVSKVVLMRSI